MHILEAKYKKKLEKQGAKLLAVEEEFNQFKLKALEKNN